jgi:hypothetical protein
MNPKVALRVRLEKVTNKNKNLRVFCAENANFESIAKAAWENTR